jgi:ribonuclease-3
MADLSVLQERIGYAFKDESLLRTALTHSSRVNEEGGGDESNERLEFLGDAVLELSVSEELFARFSQEREGRLTRLRARLVKEQALAALARTIHLSEFLLLGRGEESQGGRDRDSLLADAFEAVLGAVFLDGGYAAGRDCVQLLYRDSWPETAVLPRTKDFKTTLQEYSQRHFRQRPVYTLMGMRGPDHAKDYEVVVSLPQGLEFSARGASKKKAEQNAARRALQVLENGEGNGPQDAGATASREHDPAC